jgi:hypothetical protein
VLLRFLLLLLPEMLMMIQLLLVALWLVVMEMLEEKGRGRRQRLRAGEYEGVLPLELG